MCTCIIQLAMFYSPFGISDHLKHKHVFSSMFSYRARQKHITKETVMPGESKASKRLRVVLRRGTSLILCPPPPPHLRPEPQALSQTASPAKRVRKAEIITSSRNWKTACVSFVVEIIISNHAGCSEAYRFSGKYVRITKASNHSGFSVYCSSCEHISSVCGLIWLKHILWPTTQSHKPQKLLALTVVFIVWQEDARTKF